VPPRTSVAVCASCPLPVSINCSFLRLCAVSGETAEVSNPIRKALTAFAEFPDELLAMNIPSGVSSGIGRKVERGVEIHHRGSPTSVEALRPIDRFLASRGLHCDPPRQTRVCSGVPP
jgi:hypothetical protein